MNSEEYHQKGQAPLLRNWSSICKPKSFYRLLWDDVRRRGSADLESESSLIKEHIASALTVSGEALLEEAGVRQSS